MKNSAVRGSLLILLAACCYGMLGTLVKLSYHQGFGTAEVTVSQFLIGFLGLGAINFFKLPGAVKKDRPQAGRKTMLKLIVAGTSLGLTSVFYYLAVRHISVSIAIVLLAQAVWMGLVVETLIARRRPGSSKIVAIGIILAGTVLATGMLQGQNRLDWLGIAFGLAAAGSYTATMYSTNRVGLDVAPLRRSLLMITGGLLVILVIFHSAISSHFSFSIFWTWGIPIAIFGTILPPLLFTRGMPLAGISLGAILTSLEVPISVLFAHFLLGESVSFSQWAGVLMIITAVVIANIQKK